MSKKNVKEFIDLNDLQNYQDIFCEAQRVFLSCFNMNDEQVTVISGRKDEIEYLFSFVGEEYLFNASLEIAVECRKSVETIWKDTILDNVKIIGIPNCINGEYLGAFVMVVVYREDLYQDKSNVLPTEHKYMKVTVNGANRAVRLLNNFSEMLIGAAYDNNIAEKKIREISEKELKIKEELRLKKSINQIMNCLQESDDFQKVTNEIMEIMADCIDVSMFVVAQSIDEGMIKILGNCCVPGLERDEEDYNLILRELIPLIDGDNALLAENDTQNKELKAKMEIFGLKSIILVPIVCLKGPEIYVLFGEERYNRSWEKNLVRYIFDVSKQVQNYIYKRISRRDFLRSYEALKAVLNNISSGIFVVNKETKEILFCNDVMRKIAGDDMVGKTCCDYFYGEKSEVCEVCVPHMSKEHHREFYDKKRERWYEIKYSDIIWVDGKRVSLCSMNDVTDMKKYQQRIEFQANNDFLTGLYNRMRCEDDLAVLVRESEETRKEGAVLFLDLDDFKHINDGLGHQYGDTLLRMISASLSQINGIEGRCYRVGGDEFIIIIEPDMYNECERIVQEIENIFSKPWVLGENEYYCTTSMGIVTFPKGGCNVNDLIKKADIAMYTAKRGGKNGHRFYSEGDVESSYLKLDMEKNMRASVASGCHEFEVYIQPIVDMTSERCIGGEALVRWNSKKLGFVLPGDFIPLAEHIGLITSIGEHELKKSCLLSKKWSDMGLNVRINVNLSVIQLLANNIVDVIRNIIEETEINPANLVLEVTENLAINDMTRMKRIIKDIKNLGVKIALDDFGTGYSSLNYIKQMDLDIIKVDRTFVKDITDDDYAKTFVKLIADLSKQLDVQVCVEGVEEKQQLDTLKTMNISLIQGFYYGRPLKIREFEERFLGIA